MLRSSSTAAGLVARARRRAFRIGRRAVGLAIGHAGLMRRKAPLSDRFGFDRGTPVDRFYIEAFLARHRDDICGAVLEAGGTVSYTRRFGGDAVTRADVLYPVAGEPTATVIGDLASGTGLPDSRWDALVLTQVLQYLGDPRAGVETCRRILRPGGVALVTLPAIARTGHEDDHAWRELWRFTPELAVALFEETFGAGNVTIETYGNVYAACCWLQGLAAEEVPRADIEARDPRFPVSVCVRAIRA
jgi:SAM-dependent methyltransferase